MPPSKAHLGVFQPHRGVHGAIDIKLDSWVGERAPSGMREDNVIPFVGLQPRLKLRMDQAGL